MQRLGLVLLATLAAACTTSDPVSVGADGGTGGTDGGGGAVDAGPTYSCVCPWGQGGPPTCEVEEPWCGLPYPCPTVFLEVSPPHGPYEPPVFYSEADAACMAESLRDQVVGRYVLRSSWQPTDGWDLTINLYGDGFADGGELTFKDRVWHGIDYGRHRLRPPEHFEGCLSLIAEPQAMVDCLTDWRLECELEPIVCPDVEP